MKLLLAVDIKNLGKAGDVVDVKQGYGRNYLLPQGLALTPNAGNVKRVEEGRQKREAAEVAAKAHLAALVTALEGVSVHIKAQANEQGHLFGSVTEKEIAAALKDMGHTIDASQILLAEPIRMLDRFRVPIRLADGFEANIDLWVVPLDS